MRAGIVLADEQSAVSDWSWLSKHSMQNKLEVTMNSVYNVKRVFIYLFIYLGHTIHNFFLLEIKLNKKK